MAKVRVEGREDIAVLRLDNGATNAIDLEMVDALSAALKSVSRQARGLVLAGGQKFFSMGFDLPSLIRLDREAFTHFFQAFNAVTLQLFSLPLPTCCAMDGHAVAGGCILSIACDLRIAAMGRKLGLNEIKLGVPVPFLTDLILQEIVGSRTALTLAFGGDFLTADQAVQLGLVDEQIEPGAVEDAALARVRALAGQPAGAFTAIKAYRVEPIQQVYLMEHEARNRVFLDCWFSEASQEKLHEAAGKF